MKKTLEGRKLLVIHENQKTGESFRKVYTNWKEAESLKENDKILFEEDGTKWITTAIYLMNENDDINVNEENLIKVMFA